MKARFIGRNYSLGYRRGVVYDLVVSEWSPMQPVILHPIQCPYGSWAKFYENWTPIAWEKEAQNAEV